MKNSTMPAMPLNPDFGINEQPYSGLTKREMFAMHAMQGLLSGGYYIDYPKNRLNNVTDEALNLADALLERLEKC